MSDVKEPRTIVKQEDYATLFSDGLILIKHVRASYPHLLEKYKGDDDDAKGKFSIVALMPKGSGAGYQESKNLIRDEINRLMRENKIKNLPAANKFLRDGDLAAKDEYEGMFTINASESRQPSVRDSVRDPKTKKPRIMVKGTDDERIYAGGWCNILIRPWFQNNKYGKKVNAGLVMVQHVPIEAVRAHYPGASDESFGQERISEDDIDQMADEFADDDSGYDDDIGDDDDI